jgi:NADPH:quinone reductase-like Zn-dependent oxidoreductase
MREASVLSLSTITAWEGRVGRAKMQADETVLIHAGAGRFETFPSSLRLRTE